MFRSTDCGCRRRGQRKPEGGRGGGFRSVQPNAFCTFIRMKYIIQYFTANYSVRPEAASHNAAFTPLCKMSLVWSPGRDWTAGIIENWSCMHIPCILPKADGKNCTNTHTHTFRQRKPAHIFGKQKYLLNMTIERWPKRRKVTTLFSCIIVEILSAGSTNKSPLFFYSLTKNFLCEKALNQKFTIEK